MKKTVLLLCLSLIVFSACKKDENKPASVPATGGTSTPALSKVKSTRTLHYVQDSIEHITNAIYAYNTEGQLLDCIFTDSIYTFSGWTVETYVQLFNYTSFNKIATTSFSGSFGFFITEYIYNSDKKLIAEVQNGGGDTLRYTYFGNQIIGELTSNSYNQRFYYSENLDSTSFVDISTFTSTKVVYKRSTKIDAVHSYMNPFYGIVANKHELIQEIRTNTNTLGTSTTTNTITRTYYPNGLPKDATFEQQGSDNKTVTRYTYY